MSKQIEPQNWQDFLSGFSDRNKDRRARFELFHHAGDVREEEQEAHFESAAVDGRTVTIRRTDRSGREPHELVLNVPDIHGIAIQEDDDGSEAALQLTNHNGDMTVLHFEPVHDSDS